MKCIKCGKDSRLVERPNRRCQQCGTGFAFEPTQGDPVTDMMFQNAVLSASAQGEVHWFAKNVRFGLCRRMFKRARRNLIRGYLISSVVVGGILSFTAGPAMADLLDLSGEGMAIVALTGWLLVSPLLWLLFHPRPHARIDPVRFDDLWRRWCEVHELPPGLIEPGFAENAAKDPAREAAFEADREELEQYAFDRAIVCESSEVVDLLVANDFHFEHSCAVVTADGYPSAVFETLRTMMRNNQALEVFVLHDASPEGCALTPRLRRDPTWFFDTGAQVKDLGLKPRHTRIVKGCFDPATGPAYLASSDRLNQSERRWLDRYRCELLALRPAALLKRVFAGIGHPGRDSFG